MLLKNYPMAPANAPPFIGNLKCLEARMEGWCIILQRDKPASCIIVVQETDLTATWVWREKAWA